ncbi:MAG: acyl carrier protein [Candidatus Melainabacteria bacterium]|nr:acyl carrier protein [Candidatus Melainabacteria bacterium]
MREPGKFEGRRAGTRKPMPGLLSSPARALALSLMLIPVLIPALALTGCGPEPGANDRTGTDIFLIFERLTPVLAKDLSVPPETITMGANLKKDLGAEEFEIDTICLDLEKVFDADLSLDQFRKLETVGEMVDYIRIHKRPVAKKVEGMPSFLGQQDHSEKKP